ncbi:MAG: phage holin family protein, partial [bacterium]
MRGFIIRWIVSSAAVAVTAWLLPGIRVSGNEPAQTIILTGLVLGFLNAIVRPILIILTLPVTLLTFGLFLLVINALMLSWA